MVQDHGLARPGSAKLGSARQSLKYKNSVTDAEPPYLYPLIPYTILTLRLPHALLPQRDRRMTGSAGTAMDVVLGGESLYKREGVWGREVGRFARIGGWRIFWEALEHCKIQCSSASGGKTRF